MPNSKAKDRKRKRLLLNDKFKKEGRTAAQRKRINIKNKRKQEEKTYDQNSSKTSYQYINEDHIEDCEYFTRGQVPFNDCEVKEQIKDEENQVWETIAIT